MNSEFASTKSISERPRIRPAFLVVSILATLAIVACDAKRPRAHITPGVDFNHSTVRMGTPLEITYRFRTSDQFEGLKKDLIVFVHFLDPQSVIRFVDDHTPPIRTNQWTAARDYVYTRTVFIPENIPAGEYVVELGLYTPSGKGERFALNARRRSERSYDAGRFAIRESPEGSNGEFTKGWFDIEREPGNPWEHWRWTSEAATLRVRNPKTDSLLYVKADTDRSRFDEPQNVTLLLGDEEIGRFAMETSEPVVKKFAVQAKQLGSGDTVDLRLEVDRVFTPGAGDQRSLGIRVYCFYLGKARD